MESKKGNAKLDLKFLHSFKVEAPEQGTLFYETDIAPSG